MAQHPNLRPRRPGAESLQQGSPGLRVVIPALHRPGGLDQIEDPRWDLHPPSEGIQLETKMDNFSDPIRYKNGI